MIDLATAAEGALLSALAYKEYEASLLHRHPDAIVVENRNARAVVLNREDTIDIIFAGSDDYRDWRGNFMRGKVARGGIGKVYDGVADYYGLLRDRIHAAVKDDDKPFRCFGHSLGGASAEMFAARRVAHGKPVACLHTYGAPMVGDKEFAAVSAQIPDAYNWWIPGDVVPYQPKLAGLIPLGYCRARAPHVVDGLKVTRKVPLWRPPLGRWLSGGLAHSAYDGYWKALEGLRKALT